MLRSDSPLSLPLGISRYSIFSNYYILIPADLSLPLSRRFVERDVLVSLYDDELGSEGFLCEREGRVMGRVSLPTGDTFIVEPCNNWPSCHVWKFLLSSSFSDETNFPATDYQVSLNCVTRGELIPCLSLRRLALRNSNGFPFSRKKGDEMRRKWRSTASSSTTPIR